MKLSYYLVFWCALLAWKPSFAQADPTPGNFKAYYTNLGESQPALVPFQDSLFGKYQDVVVAMDGLGQVQFGRSTSSLPLWVTPEGTWVFEELIVRAGDGPPERPDLISRYAHVRILDASSDSICIHWRYYPDFQQVEWNGIVEEYFTFFPTGKVTRKLCVGTLRFQDWRSQKTTRTYEYQLSKNGISPIGEQAVKQHKKDFSITPKPTFPLPLPFRFDFEGRDPDSVVEQLSSRSFELAGYQSIRKKGIVGSALQLDGYYGGLIFPTVDQLPTEKGMTVSGWLALAAYPFDWAPLIQQADWGKSGFYLGVDQQGFPGFHFQIGEEWVSLVGKDSLPLFSWHHLAASFEPDGAIRLYVNGQSVASSASGSRDLSESDAPLSIGLNTQKMPAIEGRIRIGKYASLFGLDGLIDQVELLPKSLQAAEVRRLFEKETIPDFPNPDLETRDFPALPESSGFKAEYTTLEYHSSWDQLWRVGDQADIVVHFPDMPAKLVFWRGTSYGPFFVTENNQWIGDQSNEDYRLIEYEGEAEGCLEHMSDKQCRHSHVRIVENHPARIVIHWRYGLVDSRYLFSPANTGFGTWSDEYWTIYPDGSAVRHLARGKVFGDGWVETMFLNAPGTKPEDNVTMQAFSLIDGSGKRQDLSWKDGSPDFEQEDHLLAMVNSQSDYRMYNIFPSGSGVEIFGGHNPNSHFHWWNHWPVSQITSDGRGAKAADRMAHSSLAWGAPEGDCLMYGMTDHPIDALVPKAISWNDPPGIEIEKGAASAEFVQEENAYHVRVTANKLSFTVLANSDQPLIQPAFVLQDWTGEAVQVLVNGVSLGTSDFRYGIPQHLPSDKLVLWMDLKTTKPTHITIEKI